MTHGVLHKVGEGDQDLVADAAAAAVGDPLEVVDVEHEHADHLATALGALEFVAEAFAEGTPIAHAGQGVGARLLGEVRRKLRLGERGRRSRGS